MKSATFVSCVAVVLLLAAPQLGAQPNRPRPPKVTADVPFDFMVGQVMFPAGNYTIRQRENRTFYLQASQGRESVSVATRPIRTASHSRAAHLIFTDENGHYHLQELWINSAIGAEVRGPRVGQLHAVRGSRVEVLAHCATCE